MSEATQEQVVILFKKAMGDRGWRNLFLKEPEKIAQLDGTTLSESQATKIKAMDPHAFFIMRRACASTPPAWMAQTREDHAQALCAASTTVHWKPLSDYGEQEW